ncbi:MAG: TRAP transporter substrate-binding protein [Lachnospiraceae bacterium]|nr:TRAP transporter substrate-binding protein [Lachnospiraceae bacterium]MBO7339401.1 TRAP transporter substrate-binding protein [Lachnospiraceae bacterium]MBP5264664.1 TRAP transporter substrate-binding protein [Lachnospiraceae bacterium]MBP5668978.1 TRAP transporter substrate-binding protein [Lachnospiraceae bacterium]
MRKKILSLLLVATMTLAMTACGVSSPNRASAAGTSPSGSNAAGGEVIKLVMAEVNPLDTIVGMTDQKFKEEVEARSGGSIVIDLQASGVLGSENDVLDTMLGGGGTIDISRISAFALTSYGGKKSMLLSLPYTFVNRDHFWNFANSDLAQDFLKEPSENGSGVRGLFYGEEGFRHFFTASEITGIDSFQGMKLRVSNDPIMNGLVKGLGASPTVVSFGELYSALQTKVVDGAEQPIANYKSNAFPEVAPYMILDGHTLGAIQVIITDAAWSKLSEEQQKILVEAGKAASEYNRSISEDKENEVLKQLKEEGVHIIEVKDITPWQNAVKSIVDENIKGQEDLYQQILNLK